MNDTGCLVAMKSDDWGMTGLMTFLIISKLSKKYIFLYISSSKNDKNTPNPSPFFTHRTHRTSVAFRPVGLNKLCYTVIDYTNEAV